jgi:hypothetical protein
VFKGITRKLIWEGVYIRGILKSAKSVIQKGYFFGMRTDKCNGEIFGLF